MVGVEIQLLVRAKQPFYKSEVVSKATVTVLGVLMPILVVMSC